MNSNKDSIQLRHRTETPGSACHKSDHAKTSPYDKKIIKMNEGGATHIIIEPKLEPVESLEFSEQGTWQPKQEFTQGEHYNSDYETMAIKQETLDYGTEDSAEEKYDYENAEVTRKRSPCLAQVEPKHEPMEYGDCCMVIKPTADHEVEEQHKQDNLEDTSQKSLKEDGNIHPCRICGKPANGVHYGIVSCSTCAVSTLLIDNAFIEYRLQ